MSVNLAQSNDFGVNQPNSSPAEENSRPSRDMDGCEIAGLALSIIMVVGSIVAGITLTTLGAVTANPVFLNIGITLLAGAILGIIKIVFIECVR